MEAGASPRCLQAGLKLWIWCFQPSPRPGGGSVNVPLCDNLGATEWLKLSSPPSPFSDAIRKKKRSHAVINELVKSPFSLLQPTLLLPSSQEQELPVPPVCRSSAWGFRVTPTPAFPQRGAPALEGFSVALLALGFVLFFIFFFNRSFGLVFLYSVWLAVGFYSSLPCMPPVSLASVMWSCSPRPGSSRHPLTPLSPPLLLRFVWGITCCRSFFPQALPV